MQTAHYFFYLPLNKTEIEKMNLTEDERGILLPLFKNSDIDRFSSKVVTSKFLLDFTFPKYLSLPEDKYPNLVNHIKKYQVILENRQSNDNGLLSVIRQGYWWLFTKRKLDFNQEKIIAPQRSKRNTFGYNSIPWYASMDVYFITNPIDNFSLKLLLGILNSRIVYSWLFNRGKRKGDMLELYQEPLSNIPIPHITERNRQYSIEIEKLVEKIIDLKKSDQANDTKELEKKIDELVYQLYNLTPDEIAIIEGGK